MAQKQRISGSAAHTEKFFSAYIMFQSANKYAPSSAYQGWQKQQNLQAANYSAQKIQKTFQKADK